MSNNEKPVEVSSQNTPLPNQLEVAPGELLNGQPPNQLNILEEIAKIEKEKK